MLTPMIEKSWLRSWKRKEYGETLPHIARGRTVSGLSLKGRAISCVMKTVSRLELKVYLGI